MKKFKKGFTITELVIVIAVIAVLAAILIPTFVTVFDKAKGSVALQETDAVMKDYLAYNNGEIEEGTIFVHESENGTYAFIFNEGALGAITLPVDNDTTDSKITYNGTTYYASAYDESEKVTVYEIEE